MLCGDLNGKGDPRKRGYAGICVAVYYAIQQETNNIVERNYAQKTHKALKLCVCVWGRGQEATK